MVQSHPDDIPAFRNDGEAEEDAAHKCLVCHEQFPSVAAMQQHLRVCINTGRSLILSLQQLTQEQLLACQDPKPTSEEGLEERHECQLCGENLKSAEFLKTHIDSHLTPTAGEIKCAFGNKCSLVFSCAETLKEHRKEHYKALQYSCEVCGKRFLRKSNKSRHMVRHSKEQSFLCDTTGCSYIGKTKENLQRHMASHCYVISTCHLCGKNLKANFLKRHFARHETETPGVLKCLYLGCKQLFQKGNDLSEHTEQVHQVEKNFQCSLCAKWYASKSNVKRHLQWHFNLKLFKCDVAGCCYLGRTAGGLKTHGNYMHKFQYFTCAYCGNKCKSAFYHRQHVKKHMTDVEGVFKCLVTGCKETFSEVQQLRKHVQQTDSHDSVKQFACNVCGQINPSKILLDTHMLQQHQVGKFACPVPGCTFLSKTLTQIHLHQVSAHIVSFQNTCKLCGQGCYSAAQFQQHTEAHKMQEEEIIQCLFEECSETFSDPLHLRTHMKQHGNIHECDVPDCLFASSSEIELQLHKISLHSIWPHNCNMCGKGFEQFTNLMTHLRYHLTDVPGVYKCLNCKETFTSEADLKKHVDIHKETLPKVMDSSVLTLQSLEDPNSKANECSLCGKIITTRVFLKKHILKHVTQTPGVIKCIIKGCDLTFTSAAQLKEHASITHWDLSKSKERSLACDVPGCNKSFKNIYNLQRHKRTVHSPTPWTCHLCDKNFKDAVYGARHVKTVHANQQQ